MCGLPAFIRSAGINHWARYQSTSDKGGIDELTLANARQQPEPDGKPQRRRGAGLLKPVEQGLDLLATEVALAGDESRIGLARKRASRPAAGLIHRGIHHLPPETAVETSRQQGRKLMASGQLDRLAWPALLRMLDRQCPDFRS